MVLRDVYYSYHCELFSQDELLVQRSIILKKMLVVVVGVNIIFRPHRRSVRCTVGYFPSTDKG